MKEILCYEGIDPTALTEPYFVAVATNAKGNLSTSAVMENGIIAPDACIYRGSLDYAPQSVVEMPFGGGSVNSQGWLRDLDYFNQAFYRQAPEAFSPENLKQLQKKEPLVVDRQMIDVFPQYKGFEGQKLKHHHIGGDGQAVGIPESLHIGNGGVHNTEKRLGITQNAQEFSDYYKRASVERPELSRDDISARFVLENQYAPIPGDFSQGVSFLCSKDNYERYIANGPGFLGRGGIQFVAPSQEIDQVLRECNGDPRAIEQRLGLKDNSLGHAEIYRVDIPDPGKYTMKLPTKETPGSNENYVPGGKTSGGVHEAVILDVPAPGNDPSETNVTCIPMNQERRESESNKPQEVAEDGVLAQNNRESNPTSGVDNAEGKDDNDVLKQNGELERGPVENGAQTTVSEQEEKDILAQNNVVNNNEGIEENLKESEDSEVDRNPQKAGNFEKVENPQGSKNSKEDEDLQKTGDSEVVGNRQKDEHSEKIANLQESGHPKEDENPQKNGNSEVAGNPQKVGNSEKVANPQESENSKGDENPKQSEKPKTNDPSQKRNNAKNRDDDILSQNNTDDPAAGNHKNSTDGKNAADNSAVLDQNNNNHDSSSRSNNNNQGQNASGNTPSHDGPSDDGPSLE